MRIAAVVLRASLCNLHVQLPGHACTFPLPIPPTQADDAFLRESMTMVRQQAEVRGVNEGFVDYPLLVEIDGAHEVQLYVQLQFPNLNSLTTYAGDRWL